MAQLRLNCPYAGCLTTNASFTAHSGLPVKPGANVFISLMQCGVCGNGIVCKFEGPFFVNWVTNKSGEVPRMVDMWPKREEPNIPTNIPDNVKNYFLQAKSGFAHGHWDSAGAMFRKALDVSLRSLNPTGKGTIYDRIESLPESVGVTAAMKSWAHEVRRLGADAAHDEDPFTESEAKILQSFAEMFLTYAFSLPAMLASNKVPGSSP
jgi:Domain of unknown function (DUF4145)